MVINLCPSLFKPTSTVDGILTRIRIPFGVINHEQIEAISNLSNTIYITNRTHIQIRTSELLPDRTLKDLQELGLAAQNPDLDHLRNIMISPTAGIDVQALLDTREVAIAILNYLQNNPKFSILSQKFSIGIDGGESVSIRNYPNDIGFQAIQYQDQVYFSLNLVNISTGVLIELENALEVLANLVEAYYQYTIQALAQNPKPPRLRDLIDDLGMSVYLDKSDRSLGFFNDTYKNDNLTIHTKHLSGRYIGVHNQRQSEFAYIGVVVALGQLETFQFSGLGAIAQNYGNGNLRLTPDQNLIIADIPKSQIVKVKEQINELELSIDPNHVYAGMAACTGITGCKSGVTDTQSDAKAIASQLQKSLKLDCPINIHLTGCEKSCAQHHQGDLTLLGIDNDTYQIFLGEGEKFGREVGEYSKSELPSLISELIQIYQYQRKSDDQSFGEFVNYQMIAEIKNLLNNKIKRAK